MFLVPLLSLVATWIIAVPRINAYIPAQPTNDTTQITQSNDFIQLSWQILGTQSQGIFRDSVSRQLIADNSTQVGTQYAAKGALVHFAEANATQDTASPPWVAFVNCDSNATDASMEIDIFTEVGSLGAVAALLYSLTANACLMNQEYIQDFQKPIDVYSTTNLQAARLIDSQFQNVGSSAYWYNSAMLNASSSSIYSQLSNTAQVLSSAAVSASADTTSTDGTDTNNATSFVVSDLTSISSTIDPNDGMNATMMTLNEAATTATPVTGRAKRQAATSSTTHLTTASSSHIAASAVVTSQAPAYLIAVLANVNTVFASNSSNGSSGNGTGSSSSTNSSGGQNMTGFAMIILYAITGCVTIMFLIVIASGAIKALRHPERYGPRSGNGAGSAQTRARGITRAILDTFPVVKFGHNAQPGTEQQQEPKEGVAMLDIESGQPNDLANTTSSSLQKNTIETTDALLLPSLPHSPVDSQHEGETSEGAQTVPGIDPLDVDHGQTCPICVQDFEEGDDLRILPCDGRHRFHRDCIDPWLLGVSSLCPLCRWDLAKDADEEAGSGDEEQGTIAHGRDRSGSTSNFRARARRMLSSTSMNQSSIVYSRDNTASTRFARYLTQVREARTRGGRRQSARRAAAAVSEHRAVPFQMA